jgi:hypothetical protein
VRDEAGRHLMTQLVLSGMRSIPAGELAPILWRWCEPCRVHVRQRGCNACSSWHVVEGSSSMQSVAAPAGCWGPLLGRPGQAVAKVWELLC